MEKRHDLVRMQKEVDNAETEAHAVSVRNEVQIMSGMRVRGAAWFSDPLAREKHDPLLDTKHYAAACHDFHAVPFKSPGPTGYLICIKRRNQPTHIHTMGLESLSMSAERRQCSHSPQTRDSGHRA